jgi:hypothetical protein
VPAGGAEHVCHVQRQAVVQATMANPGEDTATVTALNEGLGRQCSAVSHAREVVRQMDQLSETVLVYQSLCICIKAYNNLAIRFMSETSLP